MDSESSDEYSDESSVPPKKVAKFGKESSQAAMVTPGEGLEILLNFANTDVSNQTEDQSQLSSILAGTFTACLNDSSINDWEPHMHNEVNAMCKNLVELYVRKMDGDLIPVLNALVVVFDPNNKFHTFNASKPSESVPPESNIPDEKLYARPPADPSDPRGWLVDLVNRFGELGGFVILLSRFQPGSRILTIGLMHALLQPFGLCYEILTHDTIVKYLLPIVERVQVVLDTLTIEKLRLEAESPSINHDLSGIITSMKILASRLPEQEKIVQNLELLKARLMFKPFDTVEIVRDISRSNLLLDFNLEQWNYFLKYFTPNWMTANDDTREKMLRLLSQRAEQYKDDAMLHRVLKLLWDLAHSDEISTEIMNNVLSTHTEILVYINPQNRDEQFFVWLDKCVVELQISDKWSLPALDLIGEIFEVFDTYGKCTSLKSAIRRLEREYNIMDLIIQNLTNYMNKARRLVKENPDVDEKYLKPDGRYNHEMQVQKRLDIFPHLMGAGQLSLGLERIKQMWQLLVEQPVFPSDRERYFKWFIESMDPDVCFEQAVTKDFFEQNILHFDPSLLTPNGFEIFARFFQDINKNREENSNVKEYLWRVVTDSEEDVAHSAYDMLRKMIKNAGRKLKLSDAEIHSTFIAECTSELQIHSRTLLCFTGLNFKKNNQRREEIVMITQRMGRITKFIEQYLRACGWEETEKLNKKRKIN